METLYHIFKTINMCFTAFSVASIIHTTLRYVAGSKINKNNIVIPLVCLYITGIFYFFSNVLTLNPLTLTPLTVREGAFVVLNFILLYLSICQFLATLYYNRRHPEKDA